MIRVSASTMCRSVAAARRPTAGMLARSFAAAPGTGRGPVSWAGLVVSGAVACTFVAYYNVEKDRLQTLVTTKQKTIGKPSLGGPWSLVDMHGKPVTDADYRGKHVLFYYGFTRCPDICPRLFQLSLRACINGTGRLYLITVGPFGVWETRYTSGNFG